METKETILRDVFDAIISEYNWIYAAEINNDKIIIEQRYSCVVNIDCCDAAKANGEIIVEKFGRLNNNSYIKRSDSIFVCNWNLY